MNTQYFLLSLDHLYCIVFFFPEVNQAPIAIEVNLTTTGKTPVVEECQNLCKRRDLVLLPLSTQADRQSVLSSGGALSINTTTAVFVVTAARLCADSFGGSFLGNPFGTPTPVRFPLQHTPSAYRNVTRQWSNLPDREENCIAAHHGSMFSFSCHRQGEQFRKSNGGIRIDCACQLEGRENRHSWWMFEKFIHHEKLFFFNCVLVYVCSCMIHCDP